MEEFLVMKKSQRKNVMEKLRWKNVINQWNEYEN